MINEILALLKNKKFALVVNSIVMATGICNVPHQDGVVFGMILLAIGSTAAIAFGTDDL